jgi:hypothetical protein
MTDTLTALDQAVAEAFDINCERPGGCPNPAIWYCIPPCGCTVAVCVPCRARWSRIALGLANVQCANCEQVFNIAGIRWEAI